MSKGSKILFLVILFLAMLLAISYSKYHYTVDKYVPIKPLAAHGNGDFFMGSKICKDCHVDVYTSHLLTGHFKTSAIANNQTIKGPLGDGENAFRLNDSITVKISSSNNQIVQEVQYGKLAIPISKEQIDIVIGSGTRGQSFLTWIGSNLYQVQITYSAQSNKWINSPGYNRDTISLLRPIESACIVCHSTYLKKTDFFGEGNSYDKSQILLGIDCERCHGPSAKHVNHHKKFPKEVEPAYITKYDSLSRKQRLDMCALCHSGIREQENGDPFSFSIGDDLEDYYREYRTELEFNNLDVHGNQLGLLKESKCFKSTPTMDCSTCHDPHKNQRGDSNYFNNICMNCHESNKTMCNNDASVNLSKNNSCIACHMPLIDSKSMTLQLDDSDKETPEQFRTHLIGVYD